MIYCDAAALSTGTLGYHNDYELNDPQTSPVEYNKLNNINNLNSLQL